VHLSVTLEIIRFQGYDDTLSALKYCESLYDSVILLKVVPIT
jgi:hypothetical protein